MIHHICANRSNAGDWLSAQGIQSLLAPHEFTEHLCDDPFIKETVDALRSAGPEDLVVAGGGGLLMDYFTSFWEGLAAIVGRVPVAVWWVGYVDLKREDMLPPADLVKGVLSRCRICRVRDELTRSRLHGCILGLAMGRKVLAVSGDRKVESFMESAGLSDWVMDADEVEGLQARLEALEVLAIYSGGGD